MKTQKQFRFLAMAVMVLGIIHVCAFPFVIGIANPLGYSEKLAFSFMYIMTGFATIFAGWLQLVVLKNLPLNFNELKILKGTVVFMSILGFGSVATMWDNPFAYIGLLIALYEIYLVIRLK
jgi:hypothetical protein